jgi:tetratricopeptide (TPR) repeat protein
MPALVTAVTYGTYARVLGRNLERHPELALEPWVRRELSRLAPHLLDEAPPPMQSEASKVRFFEAVAWYLKKIHKAGSVAVVMDDLQFIDAGSFEAGSFIFNLMEPMTDLGNMRSVNSYRTDELPAETEAGINKLVESGLAVKIELRPLVQEDIQHLLENLDLARPLTHTEALTRYTGGNPMFVLETIKSWLESGQEDMSQPFQASGKVTAVIQKRLERLQPLALKLARVAAISGTDFTAQLAETILKLDALELTESFAELERLQVLRGTAFAHDLIYEATLSGIPAPIKTLLHERVAGCLETTNANPARIAQHYLDAAEEVKAISHLLSAAQQAVAVYNLKEATRLYLQTAYLLEAQGETGRTFEALYSAVNLLVSFDTAHNEHLLQKLFSLARSDEQKAKAHLAECKNLTALGRAKDAEQAAQQGLHYARAIQDKFLEAELLLVLGQALWNGAKLAESRRALEQAISLSEAQSDLNNLAWGRFWLGVYLFEDNSFAEGNEQLLQAEQLFAALNQPREQMSIISQLAINDIKQGRVREALGRFLKVQPLLNNLNSIVADHIENQQILAACWLHLADYQNALDCIKDATEKSLATRVSFVGVLHSTQSAIFTELGDFGQARKELQLALEWPDYSAYHQLIVLVNQLRLEQQEGQVSPDFLAEIESKIVAFQGSIYHRCFFLNLKAATMTGEEKLLVSKEALELAQSYQLGGLLIAAHLHCARAFFDLEQSATAAEHSSSAINLLASYTPQSLTSGEVFFTHYQILDMMKDASATRWLEQSLAWLMDVAANHVPAEYHDSFLTKNPVNKAILDEATRVGIRLSVP